MVKNNLHFEFYFYCLRIFIAQISGSIAAHSRCINAIDCNEEGLVASVSDDCYLRIWKLSGDAENLQVHISSIHKIRESFFFSPAI